MKKRLALSLVLIAGIFPPTAAADSIIVDGTEYSEVVVTESPSFYIVEIPETGEFLRARKHQVSKLSLTSTTAERAVMRAKGRSARGSETPRLDTVTKVAPVTSPRVVASERSSETATVPVLRLTGDEVRAQRAAEQKTTGNTVARIKLDRVPLGTALDAVLRPMNLDYEIRDYGLYISSPDRLRTGTARNLETRIYNNVGGYETLPKIVLRNPPVQAQTAGGSFGFGTSGRSNGSSFGGNQFGQTGGIAAGGFGNGGGFGGGGAQGGFGGGRGGTSVADQVSNVSQLFGTIDDRRVGEAPAVIGTYFMARPSRR